MGKKAISIDVHMTHRYGKHQQELPTQRVILVLGRKVDSYLPTSYYKNQTFHKQERTTRHYTRHTLGGGTRQKGLKIYKEMSLKCPRGLKNDGKVSEISKGFQKSLRKI